MLRLRCLALIILCSLTGCQTCGNPFDDEACEKKRFNELQKAINIKESERKIKDDEFRQRYAKEKEASDQHYKDEIKLLHHFPIGSSTDHYFAISNDIIACSDPGMVWSFFVKSQATDIKNTSFWRLSRDTDTAQAVISDSGCTAVSRDVPWRLLFSTDQNHYMISVISGIPVRLWFAYGEVQTRNGEVPPIGRPGTLYPSQ